MKRTICFTRFKASPGGKTVCFTRMWNRLLARVLKVDVKNVRSSRNKHFIKAEGEKKKQFSLESRHPQNAWKPIWLKSECDNQSHFIPPDLALELRQRPLGLGLCNVLGKNTVSSLHEGGGYLRLFYLLSGQQQIFLLFL